MPVIGRHPGDLREPVKIKLLVEMRMDMVGDAADTLLVE
jgi:hypothetical protein